MQDKVARSFQDNLPTFYFLNLAALRAKLILPFATTDPVRQKTQPGDYAQFPRNTRCQIARDAMN